MRLTWFHKRGWQVLVLLFMCVPSCVFADGKVFSAVQVDVPVPDQRALIHYSNGVERLVIETSFVGEGTNFAWIVPLPAVPEVAEAPKDLLQVTSGMFQPVLINWDYPVALPLLGLVVYTYVMYWACRRFGSSSKLVVCMFGIAAVGFLFAINIPTRLKARGPIKTEVEAVILARQRVGAFDTVTLTGKDGQTVMDWLEGNGFKVSPNLAPVVDAYVREGWVFVAARVERERMDKAQAMFHPLMFTFPTSKPVYPMRLTGVDNASCSVELYVFGQERAEAPSFEVKQCGRTQQPLGPGKPLADVFVDSTRLPLNGEILVRHRFLAAWQLDDWVGTKLTRQFSATDMKSDVYLDWKPFEEKVPVLRSEQAAFAQATNQAAIVATALLLLLLLLHVKERIGTRWLGVLCVLVTGTCGLFATLQYREMPKAQIVLRPYNGNAAAANLYQLYGGIQQLGKERADAIREGRAVAELTWAQFCVELDPMFKGGLTNTWGAFQNPFSGELIRHEATPGNLLLRPTTEGVDCLWFDVMGGEHLLQSFGKP